MKNEEWLSKPGFILIVVAICMVCIGCKPGVPGGCDSTGRDGGYPI